MTSSLRVFAAASRASHLAVSLSSCCFLSASESFATLSGDWSSMDTKSQVLWPNSVL